MMIKKILFLAIILVLSQVKPVAAQRVIVIGLDGFSSEGFKKIKHPHLDQLFKEGVLSVTTRPVMPSVTLPNWTSHFTGSGPEEHGVTSNAWTLTNVTLQPLDKDADGFYPSIFKELKDKIPGAKTAFYYNWASLINSFNQKYIDEVSYQYNDGFDSNYIKAFHFLQTHQKDPQLIFLYSVHTDHAGHSYGWMSPQYISAVEKADSAIGEFISKIKKADLFKDTHFLLITDHGGINKGHGGTSMEEMQIPWAITGPLIKKKGLVDFYNSNKNTAMIIARIFKLKKLPTAWTGFVPEEMFK